MKKRAKNPSLFSEAQRAQLAEIRLKLAGRPWDENDKVFWGNVMSYLMAAAEAMKSDENLAAFCREVPIALEEWDRQALEVYRVAETTDMKGLDKYLQKNPINAGVLLSLLHLGHKRSTAEESVDAANARDESYRPAREFVIEEWSKRNANFKSKTHFAGQYVKRVEQKFGRKVAARTISETWLHGK